jgi:hypothetical protein
MQRAVWILALSVGCATTNGVRPAEKPLTMALENTTTLRVGEVVVLHIPSDRRYLHSDSGPNGAWRDVLTLVKQSKRDVTFRAVRQGSGVIIISPDMPAGECISCATLHYFVKVV